MKNTDIASFIDHTLLKPDVSKNQIEKLCEEALIYNFYSVCLNPCWVGFASNFLKGSKVKVCSVVGFPLGATKSSVKGIEARNAIDDGATEIDMVINIGFLKDRNLKQLENDIITVRKNCDAATVLKVIIETCLLTEEEKLIACDIAVNAGADFVKTSTGFSLSGATLSDVALLKKSVSGKAKVKTSGGIKTLEDALKMIEAGADRLGTSSGIAICTAHGPGPGNNTAPSNY
ncbi:MAG: deoxyribose-phosphate aldolase [Spirochaetaceae bacterium]|nr:deoxyribose-phosphate aldolase [Spirochaetaceae bacterium]